MNVNVHGNDTKRRQFKKSFAVTNKHNTTIKYMESVLLDQGQYQN